MSSQDKDAGWVPLLLLAASVFAFNSSELMPIGLLSDIAADFGVTHAKAGLLITFYAWVVCVMSVPLMVLCSRVGYRGLLMGTVAVFAVSHVVSAFSTSYMMLLASRVGVACAHSVFWAVAPPIAVKIAPHGRRNLALSVVAASTSIALVAGLPLGRTMGLLLDWRSTFGAVAVIAFAILAVMTAVFPRVPNTSYVPADKVPQVLKEPVLVAIFVVTILNVTGQFCGYSYVEPFLKEVAGLADGTVTMVLALYGASGIIASVLFTKLYDGHSKCFAWAAIGGIGTSLALLLPLSVSAAAVTVLCCFWGLSVMLMNLVFQSLVIEKTPPAAVTIAMAAYSGLYNLGIGSGAFIGGRAESALGVAFTGLVGALFLAASALFFRAKLLPHLSGRR